MGWKEVPAEELLERAGANGYKQGAHQPEDSIKDNTKYVKKTLKDQNWALGRYEKWVDAIEKKKCDTGMVVLSDDGATVDVAHTTRPRRLREGVPPPDLATIKDFLRFHVAISRGRIDDERITVDSVNTFAEWYFAGFARVTGNLVDEEDRRAVYDWTRNTLAKEGLVVNKKKQKQLFGEKELVQFNITFWTIDDAQFTHPRNKAQVPFAIAVFCWTGARIGAFFPDQENKDKGGLRYRDIEVVLTRIPSGGWKVIYRIDQRWVKNNRDPENTVYGASTSQHGKLLYDDTQYLLALALADKAFWGIDSPKDFWQLQIPPGENELLLRWTESAKRLPILRNATMQRGVSEEPLPKKTFDRIIKSVLNSSGYFGNATVHAIRRYLGKKVNERYTEVERSQHISQTDPRVYGQSYVANTSSVDGRSAFLNEPTQHDHIDYFQSFAKFREKGLPSSLPAEREAAIRKDPQLLEFEDRVHRLRTQHAPASQIKVAQNKARAYRVSLTKKSLQKHKFEWVQKRRDWKITTRGKERPEDDEKTDLLEILSQMMPERGRLARTMISDKVVSDEERRQAIEDLCSLVSQDCTTLYRPGEKPIDGVCPVTGCGVEMISLRKPQRSTHIHNCRHKELASTLGRLQPELKYCFICFSWFVEEEWDQHCQSHLESITSKRCASITYCHTLVRPTFCPFCIGDNQLSPSSRYASWTREAKLWSHLESHLEASRWPLICPHPLCSLALKNETLFLYHLSDVHNLRMSPYVNNCQRSKRNPTPFLHWISETASQKRKRQDEDGEELRPSKRNQDSFKTNRSTKLSQCQSSDRKATGYMDSTSPPSSPGISFISTAVNDTVQDLPELTHNEPKPPREVEELYSIDDMNPRDTFPQKELYGELERSVDLRGTEPIGPELPDVDTLFSLHSRPQSPSYSGAQPIADHGDGNNTTINNNGNLQSRTVVPADICLFPEEDPCLLDSIDHHTIEPKTVPISAKKPRITLRMPQSEPRRKPKIVLRLSQPKQVQAQKPARRSPGGNRCRRRRT